MMTEDDLQWARDRRWVQGEIDTASRAEGDYYLGYHMAMMKVMGRMFLTSEERQAVAEAGREMFG